MKNNTRFSPFLLASILFLASFSRLIPHPYNYAPIGALGLFGAAYFSKKWVAILIPVLSYWLSDIVINNTVYATYYHGFTFFAPGCYWQYGAIALTTIIGFYIFNKITIYRVFGGAIMSSIVFFVISNFGCFPGSTIYPQTFTGLLECYIAGLPFFGGTLAGTLVYSFGMFGGLEVSKLRQPKFVTL